MSLQTEAGTTAKEIKNETTTEKGAEIEGLVIKGEEGKALESKSTRAQFVVCEIKGEVKKPGVYEIARGGRVCDLIQQAGGLTEKAELLLVNQAEKLQDGQVVLIPVEGTSLKDYQASTLARPQGSAEDQGGTAGESPKVNLNTAGLKELESVTGIGPVTAQNILSYRNSHGPFTELSQLKEVDRIGDKTFEKIKDYFTLGP